MGADFCAIFEVLLALLPVLLTITNLIMLAGSGESYLYLLSANGYKLL